MELRYIVSFGYRFLNHKDYQFKSQNWSRDVKVVGGFGLYFEHIFQIHCDMYLFGILHACKSFKTHLATPNHACSHFPRDFRPHMNIVSIINVKILFLTNAHIGEPPHYVDYKT